MKDEFETESQDLVNISDGNGDLVTDESISELPNKENHDEANSEPIQHAPSTRNSLDLTLLNDKLKSFSLSTMLQDPEGVQLYQSLLNGEGIAFNNKRKRTLVKRIGTVLMRHCNK